MKKEEGLKNDRNKGDRYATLLGNVGWKQLEEDLIEDYIKALKSLVDDVGAVESREKIKIIEAIFDKVGTSINFGEVAKDRLLKMNQNYFRRF